jgi:hypothetical protein
VYDFRLVHFSAPNATNEPRVVAGFGIAADADRSGARTAIERSLAAIGRA